MLRKSLSGCENCEVSALESEDSNPDSDNSACIYRCFFQSPSATCTLQSRTVFILRNFQKTHPFSISLFASVNSLFIFSLLLFVPLSPGRHYHSCSSMAVQGKNVAPKTSLKIHSRDYDTIISPSNCQLKGINSHISSPTSMSKEMKSSTIFGPNWFRQHRVKEEGKTEAQLIIDKHWSNYLAVQMGFSQAIPAPYSTDPAQQICHLVPHSFREIKTFLSENLLTRTFYDPIPCRSSNFVTKNFIKWWDAYYSQYNRSLDEMIAGINRKKAQLKESEKVIQEEQVSQKRKAESVATKKTGSSKPTSKRAKANPKKPSRNIELPKELNQSEVPSKITSAPEKPPTPESARYASVNSLDVSSKSKESSNSKDKRASPEKQRIEEPTARESTPSLNVIVGEEQSPRGLSSEGYSISNLSRSAEKSNPILDEIDQALNNPVGKMNSPLEEREIIQEASTPKVPIQAGSKQGTEIDPRIQFKEKLEETRATSVEKVKQSMKPLLSIPVVDLDGGDPDLADLLQMISELKVRSEPDISNSINKTIPQEKEKEDTPIQRARELKALKEKEALYKKHLSNANDTLEGLSKTREDLVKKLAEIQAQIQDVDAKMTKLKKPFEKIQEKKTELGNQLSEIDKNKLQNEADLKRLQEEELQEIDLFKGFEDNKIQLKHTLEEFL
ncbi:hypothetical protein PIB30_051331 [Stylosanthes scabra]|uniref:Uncharacterized protein n=1 Tax=Stylosanthes scabra TaxID=79078 RepID=A0ABU6VJV0_9FABA|nr:hypothetical protein [Stylosanthes scabra]